MHPDPRHLPRNALQLFDLAEPVEEGPALIECLQERLTALLVAVVLPTQPHATMIAYDIPAAREQSSRGRKHATAGFRSKRMPLDVLIQRRAGASVKVTPFEVERLDAPWVHGRDQVPETNTLQSKTVTIVGCGSLGSGIATLLAKAGVGGLNLVDPELLSSENVSRHDLGLFDVGHPKATALADRLRADFPHIREVNGFRMRWQTALTVRPELLREPDLLLVAIGSWMDEGALEKWRLEQDRPPPAIYGWLEPHAVAAHAVSLQANGPCFGCGLDEFGQSHLRVSEWPDGSTTRTHPACGGAFQPYGASQLAHGHGLVADLCLEQLSGKAEHVHRIWAGPKRVLQSAGGRWSRDWEEFAGSFCDHGGEFERTWLPTPQCRICGGKR